MKEAKSAQGWEMKEGMIPRKEELFRSGKSEEWTELLRAWCFSPTLLPFSRNCSGSESKLIKSLC